jgi:hypothetical protein
MTNNNLAKLVAGIRTLLAFAKRPLPEEAVRDSRHADPTDARDFLEQLGRDPFSLRIFHERFKGDQQAFLNSLTPIGYRWLLPDLMVSTLDAHVEDVDIVASFLGSLCRNPHYPVPLTHGLEHEVPGELRGTDGRTWSCPPI